MYLFIHNICILYYVKYFQRRIKVIYAERPIITFSIWTFGGQLTRTLAPWPQSSSADSPAAVRRNGELSPTHHHHGHSAVTVNTSRLCRYILNCLSIYPMLVRCLSCIFPQLRAAARWRCTSSCWRVTTRPWGKQHLATLGTQPPASRVQASRAAQRVPGGGVRSRPHPDHRRGEDWAAQNCLDKYLTLFTHHCVAVIICNRMRGTRFWRPTAGCPCSGETTTCSGAARTTAARPSPGANIFITSPNIFGRTRLPADRIWRPDVILYNNADQQVSWDWRRAGHVTTLLISDWLPGELQPADQHQRDRDKRG